MHFDWFDSLDSAQDKYTHHKYAQRKHFGLTQRKQKGFSVPLLLSAVLLLGLVLIFFLININKTSDNKKVENSAVEKKDNLKETAKSYTNQDLGFEFQYPYNLQIQEDSEEEFNKRGNGDFRKNFKNFVLYQPANVLGVVVLLDESKSYDLNPLTLWVFDNPNDLTYDKWYERYWYYPFVWGDYTQRRLDVAPAQDATISGREAKSGVVDYQPGKPKFIYLSDSNKMYLFRIVSEKGEQILQNFKFIEKAKNMEKDDCMVGGCSSQLCVSKSEGNIVSTCEFREEYACYKSAKCERQVDGSCGWTVSEELMKCLQGKRNSSPGDKYPPFDYAQGDIYKR